MKHQLIESRERARIFACAFDIDEEVPDALQRFCREQGVLTAALSGIGGFRRARLGYYDMEAKRYDPIAIEEQVEVLSFLGNVTAYRGEPRVHVHCIVGHGDGRTTGGHLLSGTVRPTLELFVNELPGALRRSDRPDVGIPLIDI